MGSSVSRSHDLDSKLASRSIAVSVRNLVTCTGDVDVQSLLHVEESRFVFFVDFLRKRLFSS